MTLFVFCGAPQAFAAAVDELLPFLEGEYCLALMSEGAEIGIERPDLRVFKDNTMSGTDFLRSALRQDPDSLILDARAQDSLGTLAQARMTGHRVIFHHSKPALDALNTCFEETAKESNFLAVEFLNRAVFLDLEASGVSKVWQARAGEKSGLTLVPLLEKSDGGWGTLGQYETRPQPQAFTEATTMEVPREWPEDPGAFLTDLETHLGSHRRTAWAPLTGTPGHSGEFGQYGGVPKLEQGEDWPICGCCSKRMGLVLQIELEKAPEPFRAKVARDGFFQFFYCLETECSVLEPWAPFQKNSLARTIGGGAVSAARLPESTYKEIPILGWVSAREGPGWEERFSVGIDREFLQCDLFSTFAEMAENWNEHDSYYDQVLDYLGLTVENAPDFFSYAKNLPGDKLLGWPSWSQGVEYPSCPQCGAQMEMLVQINNDGHGSGVPGFGSALGQVFAADGNGHISYCPEHGQMTFAWACG